MSPKHRCPRTVHLLGLHIRLPHWLPGRRNACCCILNTGAPIRVDGTGEQNDPYVIRL